MMFGRQDNLYGKSRNLDLPVHSIRHINVSNITEALESEMAVLLALFLQVLTFVFQLAACGLSNLACKADSASLQLSAL